MKCLPFLHKKREMPRLLREGERDTGRPGPEYACTRCGKLWYRDQCIIRISTIEGRRHNSSLPFWEGQSPPKGFESWEQVTEKHQREKKKLLEEIRKRRGW